jgi:hypothetical protein
VTSSTAASTAAPITLPTRPPTRTRHGYHAAPTPRRGWGRRAPSALMITGKWLPDTPTGAATRR